MSKSLNWQYLALRRLIADTKELSQSYNEFFNHTTDQDLKEQLNSIAPDLIAIQMKLQDALRKRLTPA